MNKLCSILFFLYTVFNYAQLEPRMTIKDKEDLKLSYLNVDVQISGNYALTTYTMKFYNNYNKVLEGEFHFPLQQGQDVFDFKMEVNGVLREAVIVEKQKARVAFETIVRERVDPGLLEKTQGNNYKVRVYPIAPKSEKLIVLTVEQLLTQTNHGKNKYRLKFKGNSNIKHFSLNIDVVGGRLSLDKSGILKKAKVVSLKNHQKLRLTKEHLKISKIDCQFYNTSNSYPLINSEAGYFNVTTKLNIKPIDKPNPKTINLFWDTSLSMKNRSLDKELLLLQKYFDHYKNLKVNFVSFSNTARVPIKFVVKNGGWDALKQHISLLVYDGGTSFENLISYTNTKDEVLVFTDGLDNFENFKSIKGNITIVNSKIKADHRISETLGGDAADQYINLNQLSVNNALNALITLPTKFLGYKNNNEIYEFYSDKTISKDGLFSLSGKFKKDTTIELLFGNQNQTAYTQSIAIANGGNGNVAKRLWAKRKLNSLLANKKKNKKEIISLAKENKLVTDYTSMLVLDRVEDYVKYRIEPPEELRSAYKRLLKAEELVEMEMNEDLKYRLGDVQDDTESLKKWYVTKPTPKKKLVKKVPTTVAVTNQPRDTISESTPNNTIQNTRPQNMVSGIVVDEEGFSIIGCNVRIKGSSVNCVTDFDGKFLIDAKVGDEIEFSYLGYKSLVKQISVPKEVLNIKLIASSEALDEVVVIGYGAIKKKELTGSVSQVQIRGIASRERTPNISSALQGQISGVNVRSSANNTQTVGVGKTNFKKWNPQTPYLKALNKISNTEDAYVKYLELRETYQTIPFFFIDIANYFINKKDTNNALLVLSNLLELELHNYELLKSMAYKLEEIGAFDLAVRVYTKIVVLRPEDPHSYRDLALCYEAIGKPQKAFDLLCRIYKGAFLKTDLEEEKFEGIEQIVFVELCRLKSLYGDAIVETESLHTEFIKLETDIRVVVDWNHADTDLDLWVIDPNSEKCYYGNHKTQIGGRLSDDMTEGFGPEEFLLKKAISGSYKIKVKYYSDAVQKISGPTNLKLTIFTNYGKENETKEIKTYRLDKNSEILEIGEVNF